MRQRRPLSRHVLVAAVTVLQVAGGLAAAQAQPSDELVPVTDAMLQDPDPADWLMWRRTLDGWGYSPLDAIDRGNVGELRMVWTRGLTGGRQQGTPLVHDGTMYMPNPRDVIQALDAVTGDLLWEYRRARPDDLETYILPALAEGNRNIAIYGDAILHTSTDGHVLGARRRDGPAGLGDPHPGLHDAPGPPDVGPHRRQRQGGVRPRLPAAGRPRRLRGHRARRADRARSSGAPAWCPPPASRATRPGAASPTSSGATSGPGWCPASTPR